MDNPKIPEVLQDFYRRAYASFDHFDDPQVRRAVIEVMRAMHKDAASIQGSNNESSGDFVVS